VDTLGWRFVKTAEKPNDRAAVVIGKNNAQNAVIDF
jgi:hypothetical protein